MEKNFISVETKIYWKKKWYGVIYRPKIMKAYFFDKNDKEVKEYMHNVILLQIEDKKTKIFTIYSLILKTNDNLIDEFNPLFCMIDISTKKIKKYYCAGICLYNEVLSEKKIIMIQLDYLKVFNIEENSNIMIKWITEVFFPALNNEEVINPINPKHKKKLLKIFNS